MMKQASSRTTAAANRRGAAVVEFAVCLPMLMLLVFGTIESASRIFLKQTLSIAAYESAREAIRTTSTTTGAKLSGNTILTARKVKGSNIKFTPTDVAGVARGQTITVEVTAPTNSNSPVMGNFIADKTLKATVVMLKE